MTSAPTYELEARLLSGDDKAWLTLFDSGKSWWCEEVNAFLRTRAITEGAAGYNVTSIFSYPGEREVVGFITIAAATLSLDQVKKAFPQFGAPPGLKKVPVPVYLVVFIGVDQRFQDGGYGEEMHTRLLQGMLTQMGAPRFTYLQCWNENEDGLRFWNRLGYETFELTSPPRPDGKGTVQLSWLIHDRFRITPKVV
jgi:RimJ/RimL family protein N-acetyltransferase